MWSWPPPVPPPGRDWILEMTPPPQGSNHAMGLPWGVMYWSLSSISHTCRYIHESEFLFMSCKNVLHEQSCKYISTFAWKINRHLRLSSVWCIPFEDLSPLVWCVCSPHLWRIWYWSAWFQPHCKILQILFYTLLLPLQGQSIKIFFIT